MYAYLRSWTVEGMSIIITQKFINLNKLHLSQFLNYNNILSLTHIFMFKKDMCKTSRVCAHNTQQRNATHNTTAHHAYTTCTQQYYHNIM